MNIVLLRHAHRNTKNRDDDNGLSPKGKVQVRGLVEFARLRSLRNEAFVQGKSHFVSSPKKRCVETLGPLQRAISSGELFISPQLDEQQENENNEGFRVRVENFMNSLMEGPWNWIFLCSHGDWLPFALEYLQNENILMRKAAWVEYEIIGYRRILTWVVPDSRLFCANSEF